MYGAMMSERNDPSKNLSVRSNQGTGSNVAKQRSFDVVAERETSRAEKEKDFRRAATCNNSVDSKGFFTTFNLLVNERRLLFIMSI